MSRILIYGDVHGNLPAFEKMLKAVGPCDGYICLGDLVNYGPWSNECVDLACSLPNAVLLMGNHEEAFIAGEYPGSNELVKTFFTHTITGFSRIDQIKKFIPEYRLDTWLVKHTLNNEYIYPTTNIPLDRNYIIGHSHHQFIYRNNGFVLFNAGSVGQNRKYINEINFLLYDTIAGQLELGSQLYNVDRFVDELKASNFPIACIAYYMQKARR